MIEMCRIADQLRAKWYSLCTQIPCMAGEEEVKRIIAADRARPEYQAAKAELMEHMRNCRECTTKKEKE
jgi:hypothetical protein